jgi:hypothetical protein
MYIFGNNKTYLDVHVKRLIFSSDFNQIWSLSTVVRKSPQYQVLRISAQYEPRLYIRTGRQTDRQTDMTQLKGHFRGYANPSSLRKACPNATSSTTKLTWTVPGTSSGLRSTWDLTCIEITHTNCLCLCLSHKSFSTGKLSVFVEERVIRSD